MASRVVLPSMVVGPSDMGRIIHELQAIDEFLNQSALRKEEPSLTAVHMSQGIDEIIKLNKINILDQKSRAGLLKELQNIRTHAPVVHISFAADPSSAFVMSIVDWFRREIDPVVLLQVGLQPNIAAGCVVRTRNKYFDFSLRQRFTDNRQLLVTKFEGR